MPETVSWIGSDVSVRPCRNAPLRPVPLKVMDETVPKLLPVIVACTTEPRSTTLGEIAAIAGGEMIVNDCALVAVPFEFCTWIGPLVAPAAIRLNAVRSRP